MLHLHLTFIICLVHVCMYMYTLIRATDSTSWSGYITSAVLFPDSDLITTGVHTASILYIFHWELPLYGSAAVILQVPGCGSAVVTLLLFAWNSGAEVMHIVYLLAGCYAFALAIWSISLVKIWLGYVDAMFVLIFVQDLSCRTV
jgi:hypothetical protein